MSNNRYPGPPLPVDEQSPHPGSSVTTGFKPTVRKVTPPNPLRTLNASAPVFNSQSRVTSICTFNADVLPTFQTYEGEISHIENGPFFFFVQLKNKVDDLDRMMHHIQTMEFEKLTDTPVLGMACLADFKDHEMPAKYRAVIMGIREDSCDVLYVDFGNKSKVLFCDLYKIPHQFLLFKTFANSFRLSGLHKIPSSDHKSISEEFSNFTRDKSLFLRVVPLEGAPLSQYCELFNDRGVSVLDILMMHDPSLQHNAPKKVQPTHMSASLLRQLQAMPQHLQSSAHLQSSQTSTPVITRNDRDPRLVVNQRVLNFNQPPPLIDVSIVQAPLLATSSSSRESKDSSKSNSVERANETSNWDQSNSSNTNRSQSTNWDQSTSSNQPQQQSQTHPETVASNNTHQHRDYVELSADKSNWDSFSKTTVPPVVPQNSSRQASPKKTVKLPAQKSPDSGHSSSNEILDQVPGKFSKLRIGKDVCEVNFTQWNSPFDFFVKLDSYATELKKMNSDILLHYKKMSPVNRNVVLQAGDMIVVKKDLIFERAKVLAHNPKIDKFKVLAVDVGIVMFLGRNQVFPMDKSFTSIPAMAIKCSLGSSIVCSEFQSRITDFIDTLVSAKASSIKCTFSNERQDQATAQYVYDAAISINDEDLFTTLMTKKFISKIPENLCLTRLVQQNLKIFIESMDDLGSLLVRLEGVSIQIMAANVDYNKVKKDQQKMTQIKKMCQKYCIAKVVEITANNVLMLSLFIDPLTEESAPETFVPITQTVFSAYTVHFERPEVCYLRLPAWDQIVTDLLNEMFEYYDTNGNKLDTLKLNSTVAALASDGNWYRGRIMSSHGKDEVEILFLDYGNREVVNKSDLKQLEEQHRLHSWLAIKVHLPMVSRSGFNTEQQCIKDLSEKYFEVSVKDFFEDSWIVELVDESTRNNVVDNLVKSQEVDRQDMQDLRGNLTMQRMNNSTISSLEAESSKSNQTLVDDEEKPDRTKILMGELWGRVSHINSINDFFLQLEDNFEKIESLRQNLAIVAPSLQPLANFREGTLCVAFCTMSQSWNRAKIIDSDGKTISIEFLDSGITDTITNKDYLKVLTGELKKLENLAFRCAVPFKLRKSGEGSLQILEKMKDKVCFNFIAKGEKINYVRLFILHEGGSKEDILHNLKAAAQGYQLEVVESGQNCFVSHVNSISDFYIQMEQDSTNLEVVTGLLQSEAKKELEHPRNGLICAALYSEDKNWYRVELMDCQNETFEVHFIDFGNRCWTNQITELPTIPEIFEIQNYAKRCELKKPSSIAEWSEEAEKRFVEMVADGETTFVVHMKKPDEKAQVELFIAEKSVVDELIELCQKATNRSYHDSDHTIEDSMMENSVVEATNREETSTVYVSHANGPLDFFVNFEKNTAEINKMLVYMEEQSESTLAPLESFEVGKVCAAYFSEYDQFYRAIILAIRGVEYDVKYIDYGNQSSCNHLRQLPTEIEKVAGFAINCQMKSNNNTWDKMAVNEFQKIVQDNTEAFTVKAMEQQGDKLMVEIYRDVEGAWVDIAELLPQKSINDSDVIALAADAYVASLIKQSAALV